MKRFKSILLLGALLVLLIPAFSVLLNCSKAEKVGGPEAGAPIKGSFFLQGYTLLPAQKWTTGCVKGWAEGDTVPIRIVVCNAEVDVQYQADIWFDYYRVHAKGIEDLTNGAGETIDGNPGNMIAYNCTVDEVTFQGYEWAQNVLKGKYFVSFTATGDSLVLEWRDLLAVTEPDTPGASYWPGASLDTRFAWKGPLSGERTVPIMAVLGPGWEPAGEACGGKFYDANVNGIWDEGEPGIEGWLIKLFNETGSTLLDSVFTDASGEYCFYDLPPAIYLVSEVIPDPPPRWIPTTPTDTLVTVVSGETTTGVDFGNVCLAPIGARTIGYWKNHPEAITEEMYAELEQLCAFLGVNTFEEVYDILDPPWRTMADKLRAQLLAMTLNVLSEYVPGDALVYLGDDALAAELLFGDDPPLFETAQHILDAVEDNCICEPDWWPDWNRHEQEAVKDLLDKMNNDELFLSPVPPDG